MPYTYNRDYSVSDIEKFIKDSEARVHPFNHAARGHAFSKHHGISDADAIKSHKSAFIISQETNAFWGNLDATETEMTRISTRTSADQPFMIASILNTPFGQAALQLLNTGIQSRLTIHATPQRTGMITEGAMRMRVVDAGAVKSDQAVAHVVIIIDNGEPDPHFVTAFPTINPNYTFRSSPAFPRTLPGAELMTLNSGTQSQACYLWSSSNQGDVNGNFVPAP